MEQQLRNDRDAVIAIVAEHYTADDKYLRRATMAPLKDRPNNIKLIHHNTNWVFGYDSRSNVIYVSF